MTQKLINHHVSRQKKKKEDVVLVVFGSAFSSFQVVPNLLLNFWSFINGVYCLIKFENQIWPCRQRLCDKSCRLKNRLWTHVPPDGGKELAPHWKGIKTNMLDVIDLFQYGMFVSFGVLHSRTPALICDSSVLSYLRCFDQNYAGVLQRLGMSEYQVIYTQNVELKTAAIFFPMIFHNMCSYMLG